MSGMKSKQTKVYGVDEELHFSKVTKVYGMGGSGGTGGGGSTPAQKPVTRHFQTIKREDPDNPQSVVFTLDFDREEGDFLFVYFNGVLLDKPDFDVREDALGDYIRIITTIPFDTDTAYVEGFLLRGFDILPAKGGGR